MAKYGGGFGGGMNMQAMMQQAKKLQEQMAAAEAELEDTELTGEAGGGLVSVTIDGKKRLQRLSIKPEAVDMDDLRCSRILLWQRITRLSPQRRSSNRNLCLRVWAQ